MICDCSHITNHKILLLHQNFMIHPSTGVYGSRSIFIMSSCLYLLRLQYTLRYYIHVSFQGFFLFIPLYSNMYTILTSYWVALNTMETEVFAMSYIITRKEAKIIVQNDTSVNILNQHYYFPNNLHLVPTEILHNTHSIKVCNKKFVQYSLGIP